MNNHEIIEKIKKEHIKPTSRLIFMFKKSLMWFLLIITTVFGAYSFAFFFLKTLYIDFVNWKYIFDSYDSFLLANIPFIWIFLCLLSLYTVSVLFSKTEKGYKYPIYYVASLSIIISFVLGLGLAKFFAYKGILIERFEEEKVMHWFMPDSGFLSGEIIFKNDDYILIRDIHNDVWNVNMEYVLDNSKLIAEQYPLITIIGKYDYAYNFTACQIIPLDMPHKRFKPRPDKEFRPAKNIDRSMISSEICDFVINKK